MIENIAWSGLADAEYYHYIAKYCLPSWNKLPGDKFIVHDSDVINQENITIVNWPAVVNQRAIFPKKCKKTKSHNFWRKMQSQVWAVKNLKNYKWLVLLDTDIEIIDFKEDKFLEILSEMKEQDLMWATGESHKNNLDAGHIIFDMEHPKIDQWVIDYENIWESGKIFELHRSYDGDAVESMFPEYPSYKIKNFDYGTGFHVYDIGTVHYGSKLPKAIRAAWKGDNILDLIEQMKVDKFKFIEEYKLVGKF